MAIIKLNKRQHHFTLIDNRLLRDKRLSWRSKGMLCQLLSMPPNWQVRVNYLIEQSNEKKHVVYAILKELEKFGYVQREQTRCSNTGRVQGVEYIVYEVSQSPLPKNQEAVGDASFSELDKMSQYQQGEAAGDSLEIKSESMPPLPKNQEAVSIENAHNHSLNATNCSISPHPDLPEADEPHAVNQPLIINKEENNKQRKEKTAAREVKREKQIQPTPTSNAAAALSKNDLIIFEQLSQSQVDVVRQRLRSLFPDANETWLEELQEQVTDCLIDRNAFTKAGRDFGKKLNTLSKMLKSGQWTPPPKNVAEKAAVADAIQAKKAAELLDAKQEVMHWRRLLSVDKKGADEMQIKRLKDLYQKSEKRLAALSLEQQMTQ